MAETETQSSSQEAEAAEGGLSILEQAVSATKQTEPDQAQDLPRQQLERQSAHGLDVAVALAQVAHVNKDRKSNRTRSCGEARIRLKNASCKATRAWLVLNREGDGETMRSMKGGFR